MSAFRCRVSYLDTENVSHAAEVEAESLYEAVGLAVAEFRADAIPFIPGPMTEFAVEVIRKPTVHRLRLKQVARWATLSNSPGPGDALKRKRVLDLLGDCVTRD
jgi:hypothetical protein